MSYHRYGIKAARKNHSLAALESLESRVLLSGISLDPAFLTAIGEVGIVEEGSVHTSGCCCPGCAARPAEEFSELAVLSGAESAPAALSDTFKLHSLPGSNFTIYLDFDGHTTSGTSWNTTYNNGNAIVSPPYDRDGNPNSFSDAELVEIQRIWQRVAEDFRPFGVNVTTQDPGVEALRRSGSGDTSWGIRAIQTADQSWLTDNLGYTVGGIAYTGSFNWSSDTPVFSFNSGEVNAAETLSHEVGHALGLTHDGTSSSAYYYGHGSGETGWAPIMGAGFGRSLSQWSKGEYPGANQFQDDLAIITTNNGFTYRADDHGNTIATATALTLSGTSLSQSGIIERNTDVDFFWFDSPGATFTFDVNPFERGPNLDILAEIYNAAGQLIVSANPVHSLSASLSTFLSAGRYYLKIDGVGKAATSTDPGYSDYGSLGYYSIVGSFVSLVSPPVVTLGLSPSSVAENSGSDLVYTFSRSGDTSSALTVTFTVAGTAIFGTDYTQWGATSFSGTVGTVTFAAGSATAVVRLRPINDSLVELDETITLTLTSGIGYSLGTVISATGTILDDDTASLSVADVSIVEGNSGTKQLVFTVTLSRPVTSSVSINYSTANGTATAGSDYVAQSGTLTFAAGQTSQTVSITINGDTSVEADETFSLLLSGLVAGGQSVSLARSTATATIINDDVASLGPTTIALDGFESGNLLGGNGWQGSGWVSTGDVSIVSNASPAEGTRHLRLGFSGRIQRTVDLAGISMPRLAFQAKAKGFKGSDSAQALISTDGVHWTKLTTFAPVRRESGYLAYNFDLSAYAGSIVTIAFAASLDHSSDSFYLDMIEITGNVVAGSTGTPASLASDHSPTASAVETSSPPMRSVEERLSHQSNALTLNTRLSSSEPGKVDAQLGGVAVLHPEQTGTIERDSTVYSFFAPRAQTVPDSLELTFDGLHDLSKSRRRSAPAEEAPVLFSSEPRDNSDDRVQQSSTADNEFHSQCALTEDLFATPLAETLLSLSQVG